MKSLEDEEDLILNNLHKEALKRGGHVLSLRASHIVDFSSQYGCEDTLSYTAQNLLGPPSIFPRCGDHAYSYQLRTYGEWWSSLPSSRKTFRNLPRGCPAESQDFVEFRVEKKVLPVLIRLYEVYNPGAISKVLCYCYVTERWIVLWQGEPQFRKPYSSNCFAFEIENYSFLTDYFRIEFHHRHLSYYFELDGLILYGEDKLSLIPTFSNSCSNYSKTFIKKSLKDTLSTFNMSCIKAIKFNQSVFPLDLLPREILHAILSYLDLQSLCFTAKVSKAFRKACYDPVLYKDLNLQLYWHQIDERALKCLVPRLKSLKNLNISWCGGQGRISHLYFVQFIDAKCKYLTSLNISCCPFVNNNVLNAIANYCPSLQDLDMKCCRSRDLTQTGFRLIAQIKNLNYLDLYRTQIEKSSAIMIVKSCNKLEHLFLGNCSNINAFNDVVAEIGKNLPNIKTLDLWRAESLTCSGVLALAENCHELVELDLGWCEKIDASCGCIRKLVGQCQKLKKLFLSAIRSVTNIDVNAIATYSRDLEQLDLLGTSEVTSSSIENVLLSCKKLMLIDVSYCDNSVKISISDFNHNFPHVAIKRCIPPDLINM